MKQPVSPLSQLSLNIASIFSIQIIEVLKGTNQKSEKHKGKEKIRFENFGRFHSQSLFTINMDCEEKPVQMEAEEQILIMIDGLQEPEEDATLFDILGSEPKTTKKGSLNYDYQPAQPEAPVEEMEVEGGLKTSNRSTSTCADSESIRKCTCAKTRCQKNYCECFKLGEACTAECECKDCGNRQKLFLGRPLPLKVKCKCLKSHCLKKYCECHSMGMKCGPDCRCVECENLQQIVKMECQDHENYFDHHLYLDI